MYLLNYFHPLIKTSDLSWWTGLLKSITKESRYLRMLYMRRITDPPPARAPILNHDFLLLLFSLKNIRENKLLFIGTWSWTVDVGDSIFPKSIRETRLCFGNGDGAVVFLSIDLKNSLFRGTRLIWRICLPTTPKFLKSPANAICLFSISCHFLYHICKV